MKKIYLYIGVIGIMVIIGVVLVYNSLYENVNADVFVTPSSTASQSESLQTITNIDKYLDSYKL